MATVNLDGFGHNESEEVTGAKTLDAGDGGVVQNVTATATVTLPATAGLSVFPIRVGAEGITVTISPAAGDQITGNGFTAADGKDMIFTSQPAGSYVVLHADGTTGYSISRILGTATREA